MTSLKKARDEGKIEQFIKEQKRNPKGDAKALEATLRSMAGTSKPKPGTSSPGRGED